MRIENIFVLLTILSTVGIANAATITVDDSGGADYTRIQDAIDAANSGDMIEVRSGTYYENVNVNKRLILMGEDTGGEKPVVDAGGSGFTISLNNDGIVLDGFQIRRGLTGVHLTQSYSNNIITNNFVTNNGNGIGLIATNPTIYPKKNIISNNIIANNNGYGIEIVGPSENIITNNTIKENRWTDIELWPTFQGEECNNVIENNIGSGDRQIKFFNSSVNLQNDIFSEIILCNADSSNINNITVAGSDTITNNGLYILFTDNSRLSNIYSSNNLYGLWIWKSNNNIFERITASDNFPEAGFRLDFSNNNVLINNTANSNNWEGILLSNSNNNILKYNTVSYTLTGGGMMPSGIYLDIANYNTITDNIASNNKIGIYVRGSENAISNNKILDNYINGIYLLSDSYGNSVNNKVYNNIFNNTVNYGSNSIYYNRWNMTKMSGINIIGGPYLGGNFWASPSGDSFSQTCIDTDIDGICDSSYALNSQNIDYFPLAANTTTPTPTPTTTPTPTPTTTPTPTPTTTPTCGNTPSGQNVEINPSGITMTFDNVNQCGDTSVSTYSNNRWSPLPNGYISNLFYDMTTTATYNNYVTIQIIYQNIPNGVDEDTLKLFHYENGNWNDVTTSLDITTNTITGRVTSLSPFTIAGSSSGVPTPTTTPISGGGTVRGSSLNIISIMMLTIFLIIVGILRIRKN